MVVEDTAMSFSHDEMMALALTHRILGGMGGRAVAVTPKIDDDDAWTGLIQINMLVTELRHFDTHFYAIELLYVRALYERISNVANTAESSY